MEVSDNELIRPHNNSTIHEDLIRLSLTILIRTSRQLILTIGDSHDSRLGQVSVNVVDRLGQLRPGIRNANVKYVPMCDSSRVCRLIKPHFVVFVLIDTLTGRSPVASSTRKLVPSVAIVVAQLLRVVQREDLVIQVSSIQTIGSRVGHLMRLIGWSVPLALSPPNGGEF
nr:hypothetical protein HmN_000989800 [Hymenolepis microstoma]